MKKVENWLKERIKKDSPLWKILGFFNNLPRRIILYLNRDILKNSIFLFEDELSMASLLPWKMIDRTIEMVKPKSVLDLGCGVGRSLDYFFSKGIEVMGVEGSKVAISSARHPEFIIRYNLNKELNLNKKFDLIWSFEFAEHIHPQHISNLMKTFSNHSDKVVISAAHPGQGGEGHFNEKSSIYWIKLFEEYGYAFKEEETRELRKIDELCNDNMLVFERRATHDRG